MLFETANDRTAASITAARHLHAAASIDVADTDCAALVLSGGSTPLECYRHLARLDLPWPKIAVTLSDERWVAPSDAASNAGMLTRELFTGQASEATFVPLWRDAPSPDDVVKDIAADVAARLPRPYSAVLLGMGNDGHFASLFPDADNLAAGLDPTNRAICQVVRTNASPVPRISLTLTTLLDCREVVLLIFGAEKRAVLEAAAEGDLQVPVAALLHQDRKPVRVIWAP
ncbi:MAG: 6-phosphogluconolactonase [Pseudomonadota bacterium]